MSNGKCMGKYPEKSETLLGANPLQMAGGETCPTPLPPWACRPQAAKNAQTPLTDFPEVPSLIYKEMYGNAGITCLILDIQT